MVVVAIIALASAMAIPSISSFFKVSLNSASREMAGTIKEAYNARLAKLAYEEKSGALVKTDSVKVAWFNTLRVVRDRALNLPDRLAPLLATESDPKIVRDLLEEELRIILNDAADAIANLQIG